MDVYYLNAHPSESKVVKCLIARCGFNFQICQIIDTKGFTAKSL